MVGLEDTEI